MLGARLIEHGARVTPIATPTNVDMRRLIGATGNYRFEIIEKFGGAA